MLNGKLHFLTKIRRNRYRMPRNFPDRRPLFGLHPTTNVRQMLQHAKTQTRKCKATSLMVNSL
jgi:hypothetical protein